MLDLAMVARFIIRPSPVSNRAGFMKTMRQPKDLSAVRQQGYYTIGDAAEFTGITPKMIRHYESLGLTPRATRTAGDYRVYSESDLHSLRFIKRARGLGFSMKEIQTLLGLWRNQRRASAEVKRLALKHVTELDQKIDELKAMRATLADLADHCHGDSRPDCPILQDLAAVSPLQSSSSSS
jgi:Cu(I)-responsive transcriptional regulator